MPVITISRGSYSKGKSVAEKVAQRLGYECISRDIILEASEEFDVPEIKLVRAIHDAPNILDRLSHGKEKYISYVKTALLKHFEKDNIVYHGLAGQHFVYEISHVLKVRIIADMEERVKLEMEREGISRKEAMHLLKKDDEQRRRWSEYLYDTDTADPSLYDLVIHIHNLTVDDTVDIICNTIALETYKVTAESKQALADLVLAAEVKSALVDLDRGIKTCAQEGVVYINSEARLLEQNALTEELTSAARQVPGVKEVKINVEPIIPLTE